MLTEIIKVARIEVKAGRCYKCRNFRYCHYQSELGEIICPDCVQTLINQQLLIIQSKPTRQRRSSQEKLIAVEPQKEVKPRAKYVSSIKKIQKLLEESEKALTVREIIESGVCGHKTSVYKTLDRLIEIGAIVASSSTAKNRLFIGKNRVHLLQVKRTIRRREAAQVNRNKVLDYIKKGGRILEVTDVVAATDITKKTVIRIIISLGKAGDITLIRDSERGNRLHFVSSNNTELVAKLVELDQLSTANQVRKILQSSNEGISIGDVMVAIGKGKRNGGSYKYIKKLFKQWGCKSYKQGCGLYYYLETEKPE
ncbi:MAG: hypothetical protein ACKPKK_07510 [Dolichospermum sp.]